MRSKDSCHETIRNTIEEQPWARYNSAAKPRLDVDRGDDCDDAHAIVDVGLGTRVQDFERDRIGREIETYS